MTFAYLAADVPVESHPLCISGVNNHLDRASNSLGKNIESSVNLIEREDMGDQWFDI